MSNSFNTKFQSQCALDFLDFLCFLDTIFLVKQVFCNLYFISAMFNEIEIQSNKTCVKNLETDKFQKRPQVE